MAANKLWLLALLVASIFLNIYLFYDVFSLSISIPKMIRLSWSLKAASDAEAVASIDCSGHGQAYLDGVIVDGAPRCECNTCYSGSDCSVYDPECDADVVSGDTLFLDPYWQKHKRNSSVLVSAWHRMSYYTDGPNFMTIELQRQIKLLHKAVGNAITDDRFMVFGVGVHQLLNALVYALSPDDPQASPAKVVAWVPYYPVYKAQTQLFNFKQFQWAGNASDYEHLNDTSGFIEIVTSPNNPEGAFHKSLLKSKGAKTIHNHIYYWPQFTAIVNASDEDVMMFGTSKFTGHAGSRFGWAFIKDEKVYNKTLAYILENTVGASRDTQLRVLLLIKEIIRLVKKKGDFNKYGSDIMTERWNTLTALVSSSERFSLQELPSPQYCNYFQKFKTPSPAFGWLKCELEGDEDCYAVLLNGGIKTQSGTDFEADSRYTRLSLIKTEDDFDQMMQRLSLLVYSREKTPGFDIRKLSVGNQRAFI